jgi:hypothetical protein
MPYRLSQEQHEKLSDACLKAEIARDHVETSAGSVNQAILNVWFILSNSVDHYNTVVREADGVVTAIADDIERWIEKNRGVVDQNEIEDAMALHDEYIQCKTLPLELRVSSHFSSHIPLALDNEYNELVNELESVWRYL